MQIKQSFDLHFDRDLVWGFFKKIEDVTECMPGASLVGVPTEDHAKFRMKIKLGPVSAEFLGDVELMNNDDDFTGVVRGKANDQRNGSAVNGEVQYALLTNEPNKTTVDIVVDFDITGRLAQFSRSGVVTELASRITKDFASNLEARLGALSPPVPTTTDAPVIGAVPSSRSDKAPREYRMGGMVFSVIWWQMKRSFRTLFHRS